METVYIDSLDSVTVGILVFFAGRLLNKKITPLRAYNIPEPVTGGLLAALGIWMLYMMGIEISFNLEQRDVLLIYFFTAIGLNSQVSDLLQGGKPLLILLALTLSFIVIQNVIGIAGASMLGLAPEIGLLSGSASLIGGHGTTIAWAPEFVTQGVSNAMEIGIAAATLGLVLASLIGGPIARFLLSRNQLTDSDQSTQLSGPHLCRDGMVHRDEVDERISHTSIMAVLLTIHVAIFGGRYLNAVLDDAGLKLPMFVTCLLTAIALSNLVPRLFPDLYWPARTKSLALLSDFSLGLFLSMSLMSMQLWTIADLAGSLLFILIFQALGAMLFIAFILFHLMGRDYQAAVLSAGFGGFALGATPTAIANMTAVTQRHGPAPLAFIILPLVAAFFVDVTNAFVLKAALSLLS